MKGRQVKDNLDNLWILTNSGKKLHPLAPKPEEISIKDIAKSLSQLCRFTGHSNFFYSVAHHSIIVSEIVDKKYRLQALLHDASEFALNDFNSILKHSGAFQDYIYYESKMQSAIYAKFKLPTEEPKEVKDADIKVLETELRDLMTLPEDYKPKVEPLTTKIIPYTSSSVEALFLHTFRGLVASEDYEIWINE